MRAAFLSGAIFGAAVAALAFSILIIRMAGWWSKKR